MKKEALHQAVQIGAMIPWAALAWPLNNPFISALLVIFQFLCIDLMVRVRESDRSN